jgi:AhpD family alkylhydroperoxidase
MTLLDPVDRDKASAAVQDALAPLPPEATVFNLLAHGESTLRPWLDLQSALMQKLALDPRLRELVILCVAQLTGCEYERVQHEVVATVDGVTEEKISAVREGRFEAEVFDERERLLLAVAAKAVRSGRAPEQLARSLVGTFSSREVVEVFLVISHYLGLALFLNTMRVAPDPPADPAVILAVRASRARQERQTDG